MIESFNEMRKGKIVNASEHRSALHTSLRDPSPDAPHAAEVHQTLEAFCKFAEDVRNWKWRGCSGDRCHQYRYRRLRHGSEMRLQRPSSQ